MLSDEEKLEFIKINNEHKYCDKDDVDFLLNLIEKQAKEIEHQKEKNKNLNWYFENQKDNFVHKDKIKAKIEEVEQWELYNMKIPKLNTLDERLGAKIGIKYILQSLLDKE